MTNPTIQQTMFLMMALHDGQADKAGVAYFNHPIRVMLRLGIDANDDEKHAALLHDVIEDTAATIEILRDMGYSEDVLDMVSLLTRDERETYRGYIYRIIGSGNMGAMRIKLADLYDNSNVTRLNQCEGEVKANLANMIDTRFRPAIRMLREVMGDQANTVIDEDMEVEFIEKETEYATETSQH